MCAWLGICIFGKNETLGHQPTKREDKGRRRRKGRKGLGSGRKLEIPAVTCDSPQWHSMVVGGWMTTSTKRGRGTTRV